MEQKQYLYKWSVLLIGLAFCLPLRAEEGASKPSVRERAQQGEPFAQFVVGYLYYRGEPTAADFETAFGWWHKAAKSGYADAQLAVGDCYRKGAGVEMDDAMALFWYRKAARQKLPYAAFILAESYRGYPGRTDRSVLQHWWWSYKAWRWGYPYDPRVLDRLLRRIGYVIAMTSAVLIFHTLFGRQGHFLPE